MRTTREFSFWFAPVVIGVLLGTILGLSPSGELLSLVDTANTGPSGGTGASVSASTMASAGVGVGAIDAAATALSTASSAPDALGLTSTPEDQSAPVDASDSSDPPDNGIAQKKLRDRNATSPIRLAASFSDPSGNACRTYVQNVKIGEASLLATAIVCTQPDGSWRVVGPPTLGASGGSRR